LPILKINDINTPANAKHAIGSFAVACSDATETSFAGVSGIMTGYSLDGGTIIRIDQGLIQLKFRQIML